jgi:hypothetical protein
VGWEHPWWLEFSCIENNNKIPGGGCVNKNSCIREILPCREMVLRGILEDPGGGGVFKYCRTWDRSGNEGEGNRGNGQTVATYWKFRNYIKN